MEGGKGRQDNEAVLQVEVGSSMSWVGSREEKGDRTTRPYSRGGRREGKGEGKREGKEKGKRGLTPNRREGHPGRPEEYHSFVLQKRNQL
jgi:hypothetical protein